MRFTQIAISRPVTVLMLILAALFMGSAAYKSMRLELNPEVSFPTITVSTIYPGADPETINTLVSRKIEDAISGVAGLREVSSSSQEGISNVVASFELGTDTNIALNDVRSRIDSILSSLPDSVEKPTVAKFDFTNQPVLYLAVGSTARTSQELRDFVDDKLVDRYGQIKGVAEAVAQGGDIREIQIQLDKDKLLAYGIGIADITRQIAASTQNVPGGRLVSGEQEYSVRVVGEFKTVSEIAESLITVQDPKNPQAKSRAVRLGDVATISDTVQERTVYSRLNGADTVVIAIQKAREGNAVEITQVADELTAKILKEQPDLKITKTLETAKQIRDSLSDLRFTLYFAIFLVAAVVYVFLHNLRGMLIVAIAIPVCIFVSFIAMYFAGFTINNMTMLSLLLAVGVLVDDAIVVLENIYRHLRMGEPPREAAINGRGEIGLAALAITAADVVVFLPIAVMGGIVGQFFKPLALGFVFTVVTSLIVSFSVTPMLAARWYRAGEDLEHPKGAFARRFERGFEKLQRFYQRILEWSLNHRWFVFILGNTALVAIFMFIGGAFAGLSGNPFAGVQGTFNLVYIATGLGAVTFLVNWAKGRPNLKYVSNGFLFGLLFPIASVIGGFFGMWKASAPFKFEFIPTTDNAQVSVNIKLPPDASLSATQQVVTRIENIVKRDADVKYVLSNVGSQGVGGFSGSGSSGSNYAQVQASLFDKGSVLDRLPGRAQQERLRSRSDTEVAADLLEKIGRVPGAEIKVSATSGQGFGSPIQMSFKGEDRDVVIRVTNEIRGRLLAGAIKGVINPDVSSTPGKPELQAVPDRNRLADAGLTVGDLGAATRALYTGDDRARFRVQGKEYKIRVQLSPKDKNNPGIVQQVPVAFKEGNPIFVGSVAKLQQRPAVDKIERRDREQEIRVTADLLPGFAAGTVQQQIDAWLTKSKLIPEGVTYKPLGQADAQARESGFLFGAFAMGLLLVYMLLAALYENLLYPLIIQLAQPQAMTGAILALVLTDKSMNLVAFIGLITLTGLVGKNAILLVDYTNTLRARGRNRHDALAEAGPTRLRPILMTTLALVLGTMPIALALGRGSEFRETIGIVIIGGITLSTLLTLLVIPCSYTILDDLSTLIGRTLDRRRRLQPTIPSSDGTLPLEPEIEAEPTGRR